MNTGFVRPAVVTVLTVYGIETLIMKYNITPDTTCVVTVLTVYGIETRIEGDKLVFMEVVTVLTVYGIETCVCFV